MTTIKISNSEWEILKLKLSRKYNSLNHADLSYTEGEEVELVHRLSKRLNRTTEYILFTLSKELSDLTSNRL